MRVTMNVGIEKYRRVKALARIIKNAKITAINIIHLLAALLPANPTVAPINPNTQTIRKYGES